MKQETKQKQELKSNEVNLDLAHILLDEITDSLYYFDKEMLGYKDMDADVHLELCEFVNDRYIEPNEEPKPFKLILLPRGSFKSSVVTIGYTVQSIVKNPDIRILIANEKFDNAKDFLAEAKGHFERNDKFRQLYGEYVSQFGWREDSIIVGKRTKNLKEPTVSCAGIEVVKVGMHYDLIIMDDLVSDKNTTTKEQMDKVKDFYRLALSLLEPDGKIVVIGTRWSFNDLYNHLIENEKHRFNYYIRGAYNPDGSLWFPRRLTEDFLQDQRRSQSSYQFACQYLNNPVDDESARFKKDWIKYYSIHLGGKLVPDLHESKQEFFNIKDCNTYLHVDPATSDRKRGDFTAFIVTAVSPDDFIYVLEAKREKINLTQLIDRLFEYYKKYNPRRLLIEMQATQAMIKFPLFEEQKRRRIYLPIEEIQHSWQKSKEDRISGLVPRFEFGTIFMKSDMTELEDELIRFPVGQHDDLIDALSFGLKYWKKPTVTKRDDVPANSFYGILKAKRNKNNNDFKKYIEKQPYVAWR